MAQISTKTVDEFQAKAVDNSKVAIVDFWASWCPPCRMMAPILESIAKDMDDKVDVIKVDVEASADNQKLASDHGVQGIPNMQIYKGGKVVAELVGYRPKDALLTELNKYLA